MNEDDLKKLSICKLIRLIILPKAIIHDSDLCCKFMSTLPKHLGVYESNLRKRTKSELVKLLMNKMNNKPEIKLINGIYTVYEHLPDSNITIIYKEGLIECEEDLNADK